MISLLLVIVFVLTIDQYPVAGAEKSFATSQETVSNIAIGWNLGNTFDCTGDWIKQSTDAKPYDYEKAWGNPVTTKAMLIKVKEAGFNAVRIPVTYSGHFDENGIIDNEWLKRVQEVVDYVTDEGMYCIINIHHDTGSGAWLKASSSNYDTESVIYRKLWKQIAEYFKSYDDKLIFECFNEILDDNNNWSNTEEANYRALNDLYQIFIDTIRGTGGNNGYRNLIINPYAANSGEYNMKMMELPKDKTLNHLIIEVHNYDPMSFTSSSATWTTMTDQWGSTSDKEALDKTFDVVKKYSDQYGVPVIIGEFGCEDKNNDSERAEYANYFVTAAGARGIKCFWWDDGGGFKLLDRTTCQFIHTDVVKAMITAANQYQATKEIIPVIKADQTILGVSSEYKLSLRIRKIQLKAKSSGDGAISYQSSNTKVLKVGSTSGKITLTGNGTAKITIIAASTDHYNLAKRIITIKVTK